MRKFLGIGIATGLLLASSLQAQIGLTSRIATSNDGNIHDDDDIGALAFEFAIIASFGRQNAYVHCDYNDHLGKSTANGEKEMIESATGGARHFGVNPAILFNDMDAGDLTKAIANFKKEGDKSSETDKLIYVTAGPMEVPWRCLSAVDPAKRQFITLISHSAWNNEHVDAPNTHTWNALKAIGGTNGGAKFISISDQNAFLGTSADWSAGLKALPGEHFAWLEKRSLFKSGDVSDCGMMWYAMTGSQNGKPADLLAKFATYKSGGTALQTTKNSTMGSLMAMGVGNSLRVNLPFQGAFSGITISDLKGQRMVRTIPEGSVGWIDISGLNLANGDYVVSTIEKKGASQKTGKVHIAK